MESLGHSGLRLRRLREKRGETEPLGEPSERPSIIIQTEIDDLERELRSVRKKVRWHFVWTVTGLSPAALLPMIGLFREGSYGLVILLAVFVTISQAYLGAKASRRADRLEKTLEKLREEGRSQDTAASTPGEELDDTDFPPRFQIPEPG